MYVSTVCNTYVRNFDYISQPAVTVRLPVPATTSSAVCDKCDPGEQQPDCIKGTILTIKHIMFIHLCFTLLHL